MFTLVVTTVLVGNFLFFPIVSQSAYSVGNLSKDYCTELAGKYRVENKDSGFSYKLERQVITQCVEQK